VTWQPPTLAASIGFLDADDWWKPGMPARMVAGLDAAPESVMAYCDLAIVDANGEALNGSLVGAPPSTLPHSTTCCARSGRLYLAAS